MTHNPDNAACPCNSCDCPVEQPPCTENCTCPASPPADEVEQIRSRLNRMGKFNICVPSEYRLGRPEADLPATFSDDDAKALLRIIDRQDADLAAANERIKWLETWKYDAWVVEADQLKADLAAARDALITEGMARDKAEADLAAANERIKWAVG